MAPVNSNLQQPEQSTLIGMMYELAINSAAFDVLLSLADAEVCDAGRSLDDDAAPLRFIDDHASRADAIFSRMTDRPGDPGPQSVARVIGVEPYPVVVLSQDARVLCSNEAFGDAFDGLAKPADIETLFADAAFSGEWEQLRAALGSPKPADAAVLAALQVEAPVSGARMLFLLHRAACPEDPRVAAVLCALAPRISDDAGDTLTQHFGLTNAEFEIVERLIGGASAQEIALARKTSLQTVRTQIKSLLSKTGFASQVELIRQLAAFRSMPRISKTALSAAPTHHSDMVLGGAPEIQSLRCRSGDRLDYALIGPEGGETVLFIHGLIDGLRMPQHTHALLHDRNIRLLAPVRPHFGASSGYPPGTAPGEACADLIVELLDTLRLTQPLPVIGHMAGALHAYHLSIRHPERVSHIVSVAGAVPMAEPWQFANMSKGHRIAGLTARRSPALLRLLTRGGIQLLRDDRQDFMIRLFFYDSPVDREFAQSAEMRSIVFERFRFVTAQGPAAFEIDLKQVSSDWTDLSRRIAHPVGLVHGEHDRVVLLQGVEGFADRLAAPLLVCSGSGQLVWSKRPDLAFDLLDRLGTKDLARLA